VGKFAATEMGMFLLRQMLETRRKEVLSREEAIALLKEAMEVCIRIFLGKLDIFLKKFIVQVYCLDVIVQFLMEMKFNFKGISVSQRQNRKQLWFDYNW